MEDEDEIGTIIIGESIEVHKNLGPGLLESTYQRCLEYELRERGIDFETQVSLPVVYKNAHLNFGYRIDLVVEDLVIVEIKAVEKSQPIYKAQLLTYLRLFGCRLGYVINFNEVLLKDGICRLVNNKSW